MPTPKIFKHCGDYGDIVYGLPNLKHNWGSTLILHAKKGVRALCTPEHAAHMIPLVRSQPYIEECRYWQPEDAHNPNIIDGDAWRINCNYGHLCHSQLAYAGTPFQIAEEPWIAVEPKKVSPIVINRSQRYPGRLNYKQCGLKYAIFIGYQDEHRAFCSQFGDVRYYPTANLLEAAQVIAGAELYIGNQSCCYAIAEAMKKQLILESAICCPNTIFNRPGAFYFREHSQEEQMITIVESIKKNRIFI